MKKRILSVLAGVALLVAVTGTSGILGDAFGWSFTPQAHACPATSGSGGGC